MARTKARLSFMAPRLQTMDTRTSLPEPKRADPHYHTAEHRSWSTTVIRQAAGICQGSGCGRSGVRLFADHIVELKDGGAPLAVCGTVVTIGSLVVALIWNASSAGTAITSRVATLEVWKAEMVALPSRVQTLETGIETARRIRDQQQQGTSDRLISLERADSDARDRLQAVLQSLATITAQGQAQAARIEELIRRQDRLENRLGARQGATDEQPTSLRILPSRST
jgi:5-methylcytosine-specific restriction protein A